MLETPRLLLRPFVESDLEFLNELHRDPQVYRYLGEGRPRTLDDNRDWLLRTLLARQHGLGQRVVIRRDTGEPIGRSGVIPYFRSPGSGEVTKDPADIADPQPFLELGYTFLRSQWGRGFATEAATAALRDAPPARIMSLIHVDNTASIRVALRLGFVALHDATWRGRPMRLYGPA